jgi:hypothetical protein
MFKEMLDAILIGPFVAATGVDPDPDRCGFQAGHLFGDNAKAV